MDGQNPQAAPADGDTQEDPYKDLRDASAWECLIKDSEKALEVWQTKQDNIDKLFADMSMLSREGSSREMKIFWANMEVLNPSVYSRPPTPVVAAKFKDRKPLVNKAAEVLERCLLSAFEKEDVHQTIKMVRDDMNRNARGVAWVRYEERDGEQSVRIEHIDRRDFAHDQARKWKEVGWVARAAYLTREEMRNRFEPVSGDLYSKAEYKTRKGEKEDPEDKAAEKKAQVWEIWHKARGVVAWWSPGLDQVLDIMDPPVMLEGFFPCPRPAYGTLQPRSLKPIPDMAYYADQLEEINALTARIGALQEALKLKGFYSAGAEEVGDAIEAAIRATDDNAILIPVSNVWHLGNGLKDALVWMPLGEVVNAIQAAVLLRKQLIEDVYQLTGLSDIMRGATDPNETLGAQQLKSQYGSIRVREKQEEIVRVCRDIARITGEIIAENFSPENIMAMSQYESAPMRAQVEQQIGQIKMKVAQLAQDPAAVQAAQQNPQQAQQILQQANQAVMQLQQQITMDQIVELLRNERMRAFMLEIETDSTINVDEDAAKQRTTEFLGALATALSQLAPMVAAQPQSAEFAGEVLKFAVQPFRAGRALDQAIDDFIEKVKAEAAQPKPNPEQQKADAERQKAEADAKAKQIETEAKQAQAAADAQAKQAQAEAAINAKVAELEMAKERHALEMQKMRDQLEFQRKQSDIRMREMMAEVMAKFAERAAAAKETEAAPKPEREQKPERPEVSEKVMEAILANQAAIAQAVGSLGRPRKLVKDRNGDILGME